jgi:hypothetical protein
VESGGGEGHEGAALGEVLGERRDPGARHHEAGGGSAEEPAHRAEAAGARDEDPLADPGA